MTFSALREIPHNTAARLAVPFPPFASCKFLDLPPVSLRNLQARLTDLQRSFQPKFTRQLTTLIARYFPKELNMKIKKTCTDTSHATSQSFLKSRKRLSLGISRLLFFRVLSKSGICKQNTGICPNKRPEFYIAPAISRHFRTFTRPALAFCAPRCYNFTVLMWIYP